MKYPFYNSWLKWSFNDNYYSLRKNKNDICQFQINKSNLKTLNYKQELLRSAALMRDYYTDQFDVLYSGGVDSEIVLRIFKELGIRHNTIIVRYKDGYNQREIDIGLKTLKGLNIPYKIIDFDLKKFYENEAYDLCKKSSCIRVGRITHLKFCLDFCNNIPIMGEGDVYWARKQGTDYSIKGTWQFILSEASHNCNMYLTSIGRENVCDFYEFTPDIIKAYNNEPIIQQLLSDNLKGKISNWSSKWLLHNRIWPDLIKREKLTGLEGNNKAGYMPVFVKELQDSIEKEIGPGNDYWYTKQELDEIF